MIPRGYITEWSKKAPWLEQRQIEQDLIITTALIKLYSNSVFKETFAFRGGTALNKLFFNPSLRYSEDIDLVQIVAAPIGESLKIIREIMDLWLGDPKRSASEKLITFTYRTTSEDGFPIKLKLEINTREHFAVMGFRDTPFLSASSYHPGEVSIKTYSIEELLGTKMRALYQRRKGRDLFDLYLALTTLSNVNIDDVLHCFIKYTVDQEDRVITQRNFIENLEKKLSDREFCEDIIPLLPHGSNTYNPTIAYEHVREMLIKKL